ncbi:MAG: hypothetical protein K2G47_08210 [Muribaculum sp.]|nr:hypothetical protein [Muribaculum sp.]
MALTVIFVLVNMAGCEVRSICLPIELSDELTLSMWNDAKLIGKRVYVVEQSECTASLKAVSGLTYGLPPAALDIARASSALPSLARGFSKGLPPLAQ